MKRSLLCVFAFGLAACSGQAPAPGTVAPADADLRQEVRQNPGDKYRVVEDAGLKELFCVNAWGGPCPADVDERLASVGAPAVNSRVDLAHQFVLLQAGASSVAEVAAADYVEACYQIVLGRSPDEGGFSANLDFLSKTKQHQALVESMLRSPEFAS